MSFNSKISPMSLVSLLLALLSLVFIVSFRTVPVSRLWKNYGILYVYSNELSESDISYILEKNGCDNFIYKGNQRYPVVSPVSPVQPQNLNSYIYARNGFFTDKSQTASIFYIPDTEKKNLDKSVVEISSFQNTVCGTDGKSSFPWISPVVVFLFALILLYFAGEKTLFIFSAFFPVLLSFCRPLYTVAASSIFLEFSFFLLQKIWRRRNFKKTFFNSPYVLVFSFSPFLILIFSSVSSAAFYALTVFASFLCIKIYAEIETKKSEKYGFKPVMIMSSKMIPLVGRNGIRLMGLMSLVLFILGICFVLLGKYSPSMNSTSSPSLPAPVSKSDSVLPNLDDFFEWSWNTVVFPYKKLSSAVQRPKEGDTVSIPDYSENVQTGLITGFDSKIYVYDGKFRENVEKQTENLNYPALEKMMMEQGKNSFYGYSKGKLSSPERFGAFLLLAFLLISAGFSGFYIAGRKRYGLGI